MIEESYTKIALDLREKVLSSLEEYFSREIIGKRISENNNLSIVISVGNYRLFIDYSEDKNQRIRFVENIEFHRR